jgi:hypothetical protein
MSCSWQKRKEEEEEEKQYEGKNGKSGQIQKMFQRPNE